VDVLTQCILASVEQGTEKSESKLVYDVENKRLKMVASKRHQQFVAANSRLSKSEMILPNRRTYSLGKKMGA
jgi:hypothetical protein